MTVAREVGFHAGRPLRDVHGFLDAACAMVADDLPGLEWAIDEEDPDAVALVHDGLAIVTAVPANGPEAVDADDLAAALNGLLARSGVSRRVWRTSVDDREALVYADPPPEGAFEVPPTTPPPGAEAATGTLVATGLLLDAPFQIAAFTLPAGARLVQEGGRAAFYADEMQALTWRLSNVQGILGSSLIGRFAEDDHIGGLGVAKGDWIELAPDGAPVSLLRMGVGVAGGETWIWEDGGWSMLPPDDDALVADALQDL
jgi:hypothetical protein